MDRLLSQILLSFSGLGRGLIFCTGLAATAGLAQSPMIICESQQSLEQTLGSDGSILPDDCRDATIAQLDSNGRALCFIDLSQGEGGLIDDLRDVATAQEWWVECSSLVEHASPTR